MTAIVPSAVRSRHVLECLRQIRGITEGVELDIIVAVSAIDPDDALQARLLAEIGALPGTRVLQTPMPSFNYAQVNNLAAVEATAPLLLLLNDDVAPMEPCWLDRMVSLIEEEGTGVVGATLYYGNGMVQHAGVVLGLAGLCEHADRFRRKDDAGYHGLLAIDRAVAAVTGACMLVRRSTYRALGGLDEEFAVALNDVDFCLRASRSGLRIVCAADARLYHYESLSLGRHYAGERAHLEAREVKLLRSRWQDVLSEDPYYNPNLSLILGQEWTPAFPPRVKKPGHNEISRA